MLWQKEILVTGLPWKNFFEGCLRYVSCSLGKGDGEYVDLLVRYGRERRRDYVAMFWFLTGKDLEATVSTLRFFPLSFDLLASLTGPKLATAPYPCMMQGEVTQNRDGPWNKSSSWKQLGFNSIWHLPIAHLETFIISLALLTEMFYLKWFYTFSSRSRRKSLDRK